MKETGRTDFEDIEPYELGPFISKTILRQELRSDIYAQFFKKDKNFDNSFTEY